MSKEWVWITASVVGVGDVMFQVENWPIQGASLPIRKLTGMRLVKGQHGVGVVLNKWICHLIDAVDDHVQLNTSQLIAWGRSTPEAIDQARNIWSNIQTPQKGLVIPTPVAQERVH